MKTTHHIFLLALFAVWFGGFTFYTAIVVPIGTDVLGSSRTQGFVTQQVTNQLNFVGGFAIFFQLLDLVCFRRDRSRKLNIGLTVTIVGIASLWIVLLVVHPMLDAMLEPEHQHVADESNFYQMHRVYLWASTVQWLFCWAWLVLFLMGLNSNRPKQIAN